MMEIVIQDIAADIDLDQVVMNRIRGGVDTTFNKVDGIRLGLPALKPVWMPQNPTGSGTSDGFDPDTQCPYGYVTDANGDIRCLDENGSY